MIRRSATEIMARLREADKLTDPSSTNLSSGPTYLWHHEGRRARHGAAMMGRTMCRHRFYEADRFYNAFVPAEALCRG